MKKAFWKGALLASAFAVFISMESVAKASSPTIKEGVFADQDSLAGLTQEEADAMIRAKVADMGKSSVTLIAAGNHELTVTADELGIFWANPEIVSEAASLGMEGNVIQRYKAMKDLLFENKTYEVKLGFDVGVINDLLVNRAATYDQLPVDA